MRHRAHAAALTLPVLLLAPLAGAAEKKALELVDLMKLRTIREPVIALDGAWIAYELAPDRGDGEAVVRATAGGSEHRIERGSEPQIAPGSRWAAALVRPTLEALEGAADQGEDERPKPGLALLELATGEIRAYDELRGFAFSGDGGWIAIHRQPAEEELGEDGESEEEEPATGEPAVEPEPVAEKGEAEEGDEGPKARLGSPLVLRNLASGAEIEIPFVESYAFEDSGRFLAYAVAAEEGEGNGLFIRPLSGPDAAPLTAHAATRGRYTALAWPEKAPRLGFVAAIDDEDGEAGDGALWIWEEGSETATEAVAPGAVPEGWCLPSENELAWSEDGERLFFGLKPRDEEPPPEREEDDSGEVPFDAYDLEALLEQREVDVWHGDDPLIIPHQKESWEDEKKRTYRAVYHLERGHPVPLADRTVRRVEPVDNPAAALGLADAPYLKEVTWDGRYADLYRIDLADGTRRLVAERLRGGFSGPDAALSPRGRYVAYYRSPDWFLYGAEDGETVNLTAGLGVPFADEDHDYPSPAPGYEEPVWLEDESAVLLHDKFDLWQLSTDGRDPLNLTAGEGRRQRIRYRRLDLDPEREALRPGERLLLSGYDERRKTQAFHEARIGRAGVRALLEEAGRLTFLAKAEKAERLLYTRESYTEFPDLWVADLSLDGARRLSEANPEIADYGWGSAELVSWSSADGVPLDGVLIKPAGYVPGRRYPVIVYFYRFMSQRLHQFNALAVNHRPSFPFYASHGYAIFLPDIRFEVGRPGLAAVKCLVPGVQRLIDLGIADPQAIGLHGHSWSGYQTAFVITQTDLFAAAVAGAPVSNMTSAYSGIRWGSGLARQFQYERSQSRLGASLWEGRHLYIDNSPVFFADRVNTPLLLQFGDEDEAVPWYQGIELYLALRRLGKEVIFLQYRGEPHHLQKAANKLDYSIKMKEFFDHHLKGQPAPAWLAEGVAYRGE